jgi:hypothetical protein
MKLNFWQWLGVILLLVGLALYLFEHFGSNAAPSSSSTTVAL